MNMKVVYPVPAQASRYIDQFRKDHRLDIMAQRDDLHPDLVDFTAKAVQDEFERIRSADNGPGDRDPRPQAVDEGETRYSYESEGGDRFAYTALSSGSPVTVTDVKKEGTHLDVVRVFLKPIPGSEAYQLKAVEAQHLDLENPSESYAEHLGESGIGPFDRYLIAT